MRLHSLQIQPHNASLHKLFFQEHLLKPNKTHIQHTRAHVHSHCVIMLMSLLFNQRTEKNCYSGVFAAAVDDVFRI